MKNFEYAHPATKARPLPCWPIKKGDPQCSLAAPIWSD